MTAGAIVWTIIGAGWTVWLVTTWIVRPLPGIARVGRALLGSWVGRVIALAAWGEVGWHLFCQRP